MVRLLPGYHDVMASERIRARLEAAFPEAGEIAVIDRTGGGDHFHVTVVSPRFGGLPLLEQHRLVNEALTGLLHDGTIHELRITTKGAA